MVFRGQRAGSGCLGQWLAMLLCCALCSCMASAEQQPQVVLTGLQPPAPAPVAAAAAAAPTPAAAVPGLKPSNVTGWKSSSTGKPVAPADAKLAGSGAAQMVNKTGSSDAWNSGNKVGSKSSNSSSSSSSSGKASSSKPGQAPAGQGISTSAGKQWQSSGSTANKTWGSNSTASKTWNSSSTASKSWSSKKLGSVGSKGNSTGAWKFSGKSGGAVKANSTAAAVPFAAETTAGGDTTTGKPATASSSAAEAAAEAVAAGVFNVGGPQHVSAPGSLPSSSSSTGAAVPPASAATATPVAVMLQAVDGNTLEFNMSASNMSAVATAGVAAVPASAESIVDVISTIADIVTTIADMVNSNATAPPTAAANFTAAGSSSSSSGSSTVLIGNQTSVVFNESVVADIRIETAAVCKPPAYQAPPRGTPPPPLDVHRGVIVNRLNGRPVTIRGINWFGFNVDMGMVDGLWAGGSDAATDFSKIAYQIRMLGFNAVRLPFAHRFLNKTDVWNLVRECRTVSGVQLKDRLIAPEDANQIVLRRTLPPHPAPMRNAPGKCNTYLPTRNNQDRLLFAVQQFVALGMYVVLDYQPQGLEQHAYNLVDFVTYWGNLWRRVTCLRNFNTDLANRVLIDVMNEPDSMGIRWEASGDRPGAEQLYLATADALWNISPDKVLFMFEGTGQNMFGLNWGNGFITDRDVISSRGLSNPNNFFQRLVKKPYVKKAIISPHLYPPSITKSTFLGEALWKQSNTSFGYLQSKGYCLSNGFCFKLPVLVGETGSAYTEHDDKTWLRDFADFANAQGSARRYNQIPLAGWMWWAYNENSGDTGGIVHNDWQDLHWAKLRYMMDNLGLTPWYKEGDAGDGVGRAPRAPPPRPVAPNPPPHAARPPPSRREPPWAGSGSDRLRPRDGDRGNSQSERPRRSRDGRSRGRARAERPRRQHRRPDRRSRMAAAGFASATQL